MLFNVGDIVQFVLDEGVVKLNPDGQVFSTDEFQVKSKIVHWVPLTRNKKYIIRKFPSLTKTRKIQYGKHE